jgi:hypothetical protein
MRRKFVPYDVVLGHGSIAHLFADHFPKAAHNPVKLNRKESEGMKNMQKFILLALVVTSLSLALIAPAAAAPSTGYTSLWYSRSGCAYTYTVQWSGVNGAKTLEIWIEQNGIRIPPTHLEPINGKSGTFTYTFPSLAPSTTTNSFHGWAQVLDAHGNAIPGTKDFASIDVSYCTAP